MNFFRLAALLITLNTVSLYASDKEEFHIQWGYDPDGDFYDFNSEEAFIVDKNNNIIGTFNEDGDISYTNINKNPESANSFRKKFVLNVLNKKLNQSK